MTSPRDTLLSQAYSYRNNATLLTASFFGLLGGSGICCAIYSVVAGPRDFFNWIVALAAVMLGLCFLWVAIRLIRSFINCTLIAVEINCEGVFIGEQFYPWSSIQWIGGKRSFPFAQSFALCMGANDVTNLAYEIPLNRSLPRIEFDQLMTDLKSQLREEHYEIVIGRIVSWSYKLLSPALPM